MSNEKSVADKAPASDPSLLGVSMPVSLTKEKTAELVSVWRDCAMALYGAAKERVMPAPKSDASAQAPVSQQPVARA